MCAKNSQCIEPATGLVETLGDEVTRERFLKLLNVLEGIMCACVRHGSGLKPAVEDFRCPPQNALALLAGNGDVVDLVAVDVSKLSLVAAELFQLLHTSNAN